jgi:peptide/nickel transport system permease protein
MSTRNRLLRSWNGLVGLGLVGLYVAAALLSPVISPYDPLDMHLDSKLQPPSRHFLLGTDDYGRDLLSRLLVGARTSLKITLLAVSGASILGSALGVISGYLGGWIDGLIMRLVDIMFAFPGLILALVIVAMLGPSEENVILAISIRSIPVFARTARGPTLSVKETEYVQAIRSVGARWARIVFRHILPNVLAPILVLLSLSLAAGVLTDASLSFLGLGVQPPIPSWGSMVNDARSNMEFAPWTVLFPSLCIALAVLGFNLLGDGLRDALDPRLRQ